MYDNFPYFTIGAPFKIENIVNIKCKKIKGDQNSLYLKYKD